MEKEQGFTITLTERERHLIRAVSLLFAQVYQEISEKLSKDSEPQPAPPKEKARMHWKAIIKTESHCTWVLDVGKGVIFKDEDYETGSGKIVSKAMVYVPDIEVDDL